MNFATLYHKAKSGATVRWRVWTEGGDIFTEHGQYPDGKMQLSRKTAVAKNTGKANATTPAQQAESQAQSMHDARLKRKYSLTPETAQIPRMLPMLAHVFEARKGKFSYPIFVQPKLDGFRCLAFRNGDSITMLSRSSDAFNLPHIEKQLLKIMPDNTILDGELYCHKVPFQRVASWIKKQHPDTIRIGYHIYDVPLWDDGDEDADFSTRLRNLDRVESAIKQNDCINLDVVETAKACNEAEVYAYQIQKIEDGYEGAIGRTMTGKYQFDYRSHDLLKIKTFQDEECTVVGAHPGQGKFEDMCIFECVTADGKEFDCVPVGTTAERQAYLRDKAKYIGKQLTVKYFGKSEDGKPRFPVGKGFREDFDK